MNLSSDDQFLDSIAETIYVVRPKDWDDHWHGEQVFSMSIAVLLAHIGFLIVVVLLGMGLLPEPQQRLNFFEDHLTLLSAGLLALSASSLLGSVYYVGLRPRQLSWGRVGLKPVAPLAIGFGLLIGMLYIPVNLFINTSVLNLLNIEMTQEAINGPLNISSDTSLPIAFLLILLAGVIVPFAEEVFFRGVLLDWLRWRYGVGVGIIVSSIVFGVLHVNPGSIISISILGLLCAVAAHKTGSIWTAVAIHAGNNIVAVLLPLLILS